MTQLARLKLTDFRNFTNTDLTFNSNTTIIHGDNGAGKTSVLEAIALLSSGRSFRGANKTSLIKHGAEVFTVFAELKLNHDATYKLGLQKGIGSNAKLHINGDKAKTLSSACELLPAIVIDPHSYELVEDGPGYRRQYLDWLLFHVKHQYRQLHADFTKVLKQRNAALKQHLSRSECSQWDRILAEYAELINQLRYNILADIKPLFFELVNQLDFGVSVDVAYAQGWQEDKAFIDALDDSLYKDLLLGYTSIGPQRADVQFTINQSPASDILSRGQEKLVVSCLLLAQGIHYSKLTNNSPIYLFDDLPSELDTNNRAKLFQLLDKLAGQTILTATSLDLFPNELVEQSQVFHVKHNSISVCV